MKLEIDFSKLDELIKKMGATTARYDCNIPITLLDINTKEKLETKGIEVKDINKDIKIINGFLTYKGEKILLYIKSVSSLYPDTMPKFHFYDCGKLKQMRNAGRENRYVITQRKSGYFLVNRPVGSKYKNNNEEKLWACSYCLNWYNKNHAALNGKWYGVDNFDIADFFKNVNVTPITRKPLHDDITEPESGYPDDWIEISLRKREKVNWICEQCGIDLKNHHQLMQTHHSDGNKYNNSDSNLKALCIECHSLQPFHQHMKNRFFYEILEIQRLR